MSTTITSRQFNQDTSRAKQAAQDGPVYITDRGRPAHVLLTFEAYERLLEESSIIDLLGEPAGVAGVDLTIPVSSEPSRPASYD